MLEYGKTSAVTDNSTITNDDPTLKISYGHPPRGFTTHRVLGPEEERNKKLQLAMHGHPFKAAAAMAMSQLS
eukprot:11285619-Ditylum_brightwellii.AAC.1